MTLLFRSKKPLIGCYVIGIMCNHLYVTNVMTSKVQFEIISGASQKSESLILRILNLKEVTLDPLRIW